MKSIGEIIFLKYLKNLILNKENATPKRYEINLWKNIPKVFEKFHLKKKEKAKAARNWTENAKIQSPR